MRKAHQDPKSTSLDSDGLLNPHPGAVTDTLFQTNAFFDARDLMQVKYEMLRRSMVEGESKADAALAFGLSRPTFYQVERAFAEHGLAGLLPRKRGPRQAHKLTAEVIAFISELRGADPSLSAAELAQRVADRFGLRVHPRSIERRLVQGPEKKLR